MLVTTKPNHRSSASASASTSTSTSTCVEASTVATTMSSSLASAESKSTLSKKTTDCSSRTKLLNRLGYFQPPRVNDKFAAKKELTSSSLHKSPSSSSSVSLLGSVQPLQTPLNDCFSCRRKNHSQYRYNSKNSIRTNHDRRGARSLRQQHQSENQQQSRRIRFHDTVMVMSIPSRHQYSNRIKCVLWSGREELHEMSRRNVVEFQAEGWDWRTVVEDEDMYIDVRTGQKLHPCHVEYHCQDQEHQQQQHQSNEEEVDDDYSSDEDGDDSYFQPLKRQESSTFAP